MMAWRSRSMWIRPRSGVAAEGYGPASLSSHREADRHERWVGRHGEGCRRFDGHPRARSRVQFRRRVMMRASALWS